MTKRTLAVAITALMILGTVFVAVPVYAVINPLPVLSATSGAAGSTVTVRAPGAAGGLTTYPGGHDVFVLFDREVADADLGAPLIAFGANDRYVQAPGFPAPVYVPGMPIYADLPLPDPGATFISPGDTRLTPVTVPAGAWGPTRTYAAGSVVQAGDFDIAWQAAVALPLMTATTDVTMHTVVGCSDYPILGPACPATLNMAFNWARGDGIYVQTAANAAAVGVGWPRVGAGDVRAKYPSVTVTLAGTGLTATYAAWTKVTSPVLDFQKPIYDHPGGFAGVTLTVTPVGAVLGYPGDTRSRNVVIPQVSYPAGSTVLTGAQDVGLGLTPFSSVAFAWDAFADTNGNGLWDSGEAIYRSGAAALAFPRTLAECEP